MSKEKGLNNRAEIRTVSMLLQRINEEYSKRQKEVETKDRANGELLTKAEGEERGLIKEISEAEKIVKKMIDDYTKIESDVEASAKKKIEENVLREKDVRAGKISLSEFRKKGKYDAKITEEALKKSVSELETSLNVVRGKNLSILKLKERLGSCRNTIRNLTIRPGLTMLELLKSLYDFTDVQVAEFMAELESLRTGWNRTKQEILLTQGKSMSGRHVWSHLTMEEAKALQFSPLLPLSCVEKLKLELAKYEGSDGISLTLYVNSGNIEITSIVPRRGLIQIVDVKEAPDAGFKRIKK